MATDEPDSDTVSEGLRQLRSRTRGGTSFAPPSSPEGAGPRRPRPAKSTSAPAATQLGAVEPELEEESPEPRKLKGTVLASPAPEPAVTEEQGGGIDRLEEQLAEVVGVLQTLTGRLEQGIGESAD